MSDSLYDSDFPNPSKITSGEFSYGSVFSLIRELRGSKYNIGDKFILVEQEDCLDPNILKLGGVGETYFLDNTGSGLIIHADDNQINSLFEHLSMDPDTSLEVTSGPSLYITDSQFSQFKSNIAEALSRIANLIPSTGSTGSIGKDGDKGDKGDTGPQGIQGEKGEYKGDTGPQGIQGDKGDTGLQGEKGETGLQGIQGIQGDIGLPGLQGLRGIQGTSGEKGDKGDKGISGTPGIKGDKGLRGDQGDRGIEGPKGDKGQIGVAGPKGNRGIQGIPGIKGNDGKAGSQGIAGKKGDTGSSGVISAKFPLVYDAEEQSISIDEDRLDRILKKIMGGGRVSPQDMGWFASTGGGGKVAIKYNGVAITPDVRAIDFTGSGVASVTKIGGKITVNITGGGGSITGDYVSSVYGLTGAVGITAGSNITITPVGNSIRISSTGGVGATGATAGTTAGSYLSITNNAIKLDLQTGATTDISYSMAKTDFFPFLQLQNTPSGATGWANVGFSGPTKLVSAAFLVSKAFVSLGAIPSLPGVSGSTEELTSVKLGLGDGLTQAFNISAIGVTEGSKTSLFNLNTEGGGELQIGAPTTITGELTVNNTISVNNINNVTNINSAFGNITIDAPSGVTFTANIFARNIVNSFNGFTGAVGISAGSNITLTPVGNIITISSSGVTASNFTEGITAPSTPTKGDRWFNTSNGGLYTAITDDSGVIWAQLNAGILGASGATGSQGIQGNTGATGPQGDPGTGLTNYVISVNGITGTVSNIAVTNSGQTFSGNQNFSNNVYVVGDLIVTGRIVTSTGVFGATANNIIEPVSDMIMDGGEF